VALAGVAAMIEMLYHLQLNAALGPKLPFLGLSLDASAASTWVGAVAVMLVGVAAFEWVRRRYSGEWGRIQEEIETETRAREALA
jgi:branched-chain amino acid transport system permease protein